ncbi:MAG: RNase adapter RapZ [Terriglobia bacterium]
MIVTGLSGSGKGSVLRALEDLGYYCVDNLPVPLIPLFADLYAKTGEAVQRIAMLVDAREGEALERLPEIYLDLRRAQAATLLFVEASSASLVRRFSETRRPHPLGAARRVRDAIGAERRLLQPIRKLADVVIDTTHFNPHELRQLVNDRFSGGEGRRPMLVSVVSFGYRYGVPPDADLVFDVRFLPNPNFVPAYKPLTGKDARVARYVLSFPQTRRFVQRISELLSYLLPHYEKEGKSYLTIAFGCTGGRHRSVAMAQAIAKQVGGRRQRIKIAHRDMLKAG